MLPTRLFHPWQQIGCRCPHGCPAPVQRPNALPELLLLPAPTAPDAATKRNVKIAARVFSQMRTQSFLNLLRPKLPESSSAGSLASSAAFSRTGGMGGFAAGFVSEAASHVRALALSMHR